MIANLKGHNGSTPLVYHAMNKHRALTRRDHALVNWT